jgi:hypothetical protein
VPDRYGTNADPNGDDDPRYGDASRYLHDVAQPNNHTFANVLANTFSNTGGTDVNADTFTDLDADTFTDLDANAIVDTRVGQRRSGSRTAPAL